MGGSFERVVVAIVTILALALLGLWKLVEVIMWLARHIHWN